MIDNGPASPSPSSSLSYVGDGRYKTSGITAQGLVTHDVEGFGGPRYALGGISLRVRRFDC